VDACNFRPARKPLQEDFMDLIEQQLLTVFDLLDWTALYQPFVICLRTGEIAPTFYIPPINLFVHYGDDAESLSTMICWGEGSRFLPNCPNPPEGDTLQIRELIKQPAMISLDRKGLGKFDQFRDMPGSPTSGMILIESCKACREWSPQPSFSRHLCRCCCKRGAGEESLFLCVRKGVELTNMHGESMAVPAKNSMHVAGNYLLTAMDEPIALPRLNIWVAFERLVAGE
jgi:hypothetical protein